MTPAPLAETIARLRADLEKYACDLTVDADDLKYLLDAASRCGEAEALFVKSQEGRCPICGYHPGLSICSAGHVAPECLTVLDQELARANADRAELAIRYHETWQLMLTAEQERNNLRFLAQSTGTGKGQP